MDDLGDIELKTLLKQDYSYLIKWAGWPLDGCTWEPSAHLPESLLRGYDRPPKPSLSRLESTARAFACGILHLLKSKAMGCGYIDLDLDCWRYITQGKGTPSEHRGHVLYNKSDFSRLPMLPPDWWYYFNQHGEGKKVDFPMKIKPIIGWSSKKYVFNGKKIVPGKRFPIEKISVSFARVPCNEKNYCI
ncbi:uncharacterized protein LOC114527709 [Dendronephthya gigantea]|uniref:uncharacterized protein LOC114527709 n=1 Tax=Dendronephthya gigantea TaxID=151771 RepID=UPI00106AB309|nr:uncharacterized protein LOC114527709 [Dendronephthya gigantea]